MKKIIYVMMAILVGCNVFVMNKVDSLALSDFYNDEISLRNYGTAKKTIRVNGRFQKAKKDFYIDVTVEYKYNDFNGSCVGVVDWTWSYHGPANSKVYRCVAERLDKETINVNFIIIYDAGFDDYYESVNMKV